MRTAGFAKTSAGGSTSTTTRTYLHLLGMFFDSFVDATSESSCTFVSSVFLRPFPPCPHPSCTSTPLLLLLDLLVQELHPKLPIHTTRTTPTAPNVHTTHITPTALTILRLLLTFFASARAAQPRRRTGSNTGSVGAATTTSVRAGKHGGITTRQHRRQKKSAGALPAFPPCLRAPSRCTCKLIQV